MKKNGKTIENSPNLTSPKQRVAKLEIFKSLPHTPASAGTQLTVGLGGTLQAGPKPEIVGPNGATLVPAQLNEWLQWHIYLCNDDYNILL